MKAIYSTSATASGGREGSAKSEDGQLNVTLVTPKELGGAGGNGTNPEQMFAAGYASLFSQRFEVNCLSGEGLAYRSDHHRHSWYW